MNANPFAEALLKAVGEAAAQAAVQGGIKLLQFMARKVGNECRLGRSLNSLTRLGLSVLPTPTQAPALGIA